MIEWTDEVQKNYMKSIIFAIVLFVNAPLLYLFIPTQLQSVEFTTNGQNDIMFYILLIIAVFYPFVIPILEKSFIAGFHKRKFKMNESKLPKKFISSSNKRTSTPEKLYVILFIVKASLVEASFIFGLLIYMVSGDMTRMLYFYVVGIAWAVVIFPTKSRCIKFLEKVSADAVI